MSERRIETAEHVLPGHPDKLCDAAVDAIVDFVRRGEPGCPGDPDGQCGLEAAVIFGSFYLTGRIAAREAVLAALEIPEILEAVYACAGYGTDAAGLEWKPAPQYLGVLTQLCIGPFTEGEREARHLADDQAVCVGYANALPDTDHLPPAHWLARRIACELFDLRLRKGAGQVGPDGKVLVAVETDGERWTPFTVSVSLNHHPGSDWLFLRRFAEEAVERACAGRPAPGIRLNGAGMFVAGGPNGDNGLSGKKLVVDAYGPTVPIGGGAWSGKDFHKVDRLGGLLARSLARRAVLAGFAREARVTLAYTPGCDRPVGVHALLDGRAQGDLLRRLGDPETANQAVWRDYVACAASLPELACWGHQQAGMPWEAVG
jgi:S-adenosylmethionine synthetase